jgi:asparagine N-glycosylation enzyme membrane subunit Stt3
VILIALFWLARSIQQIVFFKLAHRASRAFLLIFLTGSLLYAIPALYSIQPQ